MHELVMYFWLYVGINTTKFILQGLLLGNGNGVEERWNIMLLLQPMHYDNHAKGLGIVEILG